MRNSSRVGTIGQDSHAASGPPERTGHASVPVLRLSSKTAVVHEWFESVGGSEQVFLQMAALLPGATRYVLWNDRTHDVCPPEAGQTAQPGAWLQESWLARTPLRRHKALALPVMPLAWRTLDRRSYDVVVSSSHAFAHTVRLGSAEAKHLSYVHSPARYVWTPELDPRNPPTWMAAARPVLRVMDRRLGRHVTSLAANSLEVRDRIRRFWRRDARVIHPPVDVTFYASPGPHTEQDRRYLLAVGRWVRYKNFDLVVATAARAGLPLVIAGSGPDEDRLRRLAAASRTPVTFEVRPSNERLRELYWGALALLFPVHEDFGIIPVEAMACGTPVLGTARGGLLETVSPGVSGHLVEQLDAAALASRVPATVRLDSSEVQRSTFRFGADLFAQRFTQWLVDELPGASVETRAARQGRQPRGEKL
jgi:glycosyltransferase involved in cell wall biosynthesis